MLENNSDGLSRAEIERVSGNQQNRLIRQQQDSKAMSASKAVLQRIVARRKGDPVPKSRINTSIAKRRPPRRGLQVHEENSELPMRIGRAAAVGDTFAGVRNTSAQALWSVQEPLSLDPIR